MSSKSIASVKREVKENKQKKYNLKKSHKKRTYDESAKQYAKLQKKQGMSINIKSYINIFYKIKDILEKQVLLMENK